MNTATHKFISSLLDIETITHFARENFVESWKAAKRTWNKQFSPPTHLLMFAVKANSAVMLCLLVHKSEISFTFFSLSFSVSYQAAPNSLGSHLMQKIKLNEIPRLGAFAIDSKLIAICMSWGGEAYKKIASCGIMKHQNPLYESIKTDKHRSTEMWSDTKHKELTHFNSVWCGENAKKRELFKAIYTQCWRRESERIKMWNASTASWMKFAENLLHKLLKSRHVPSRKFCRRF